MMNGCYIKSSSIIRLADISILQSAFWDIDTVMWTLCFHYILPLCKFE